MLDKVLTTSLTKVYTILVGVITLFITTRWLGPEGRGAAVSVITLMTIFSVISHGSFGKMWIKESGDRKEGWHATAVGLAIFHTLVQTLFIFGFYALFYFFYSGFLVKWDNILLVVGVFLVPLLMLDHYSVHLLLAQERINTYNKFVILGRTISLLLLLIFVVWFEIGSAGWVWSTIIGYACSSIPAFLYAKGKRVNIKFPTRVQYFNSLSSVKLLHVNTVGTMLFGSSDIIMLKSMVGNESMGVYQLGAQLISTLLILGHSSSLILFGKVSNSNDAESWEWQKLLMYKVLLFYVIIIPIVFFCSPYLIEFIAGDEFKETSPVLQSLLILLLFQVFCSLMAHQWIIQGLFKYNALMAVIIFVVNVIGNYIFIPTYQVFGAVFTSIFSYFLAFLFTLILFFKTNNYYKNFSSASEC